MSLYALLKQLAAYLLASFFPPQTLKMGQDEPTPPPPPEPAPPAPPAPPSTPEHAPTYLLWDTPEHARHSVRVLCDEEGLSVKDKNDLCATIGAESGWQSYYVAGPKKGQP